MRWRLSSRANRGLLAIGGLSLLGWLTWQNLADELAPPTNTAGGYAQRVDNATSWQYDEAGQLAYRLDSSQAIQLDQTGTGGDRYELDTPRATLLDADPSVPPWTLRAERGTVTDQGETVELAGSVHAQRDPYQERGQLELTTEQLWLYPAQRQARTEVPGQFRETAPDGTPRWHSDAKQIALDWGNKVLTQTGQVRDEIQPGSTDNAD